MDFTITWNKINWKSKCLLEAVIVDNSLWMNVQTRIPPTRQIRWVKWCFSVRFPIINSTAHKYPSIKTSRFNLILLTNIIWVICLLANSRLWYHSINTKNNHNILKVPHLTMGSRNASQKHSRNNSLLFG